MALPKGLLSECRLAAGELGQSCPLVFLELLWRLESGQATIGAPVAEDQRVNGSRVLTRPRGGGKTTEAVRWLLAGHPLKEYPHWSRILVLPTQARWERVMQQWGQTFTQLSFGRVVITLDELPAVLRGLPHAVQICCDDADELIMRLMGINPDVLTMTGLTVPHLPGRDAPPGPIKFLV